MKLTSFISFLHELGSVTLVCGSLGLRQLSTGEVVVTVIIGVLIWVDEEFVRFHEGNEIGGTHQTLCVRHSLESMALSVN